MILASSAPSDITTAVTNPSPLASSSFVSSDPETLRRLRRGLQRSVAWELEVATLLQSKAQPHHPQEPLLHQHNKTGGGRGPQNVVLRPKPTTKDVLSDSEQSRDVHDRTAPRQGRDGSATAEAASSRQLAYVAVLDGAVVQHWLDLLEGKRGGGGEEHQAEEEGANHHDDDAQGRRRVGAEADFGGDVGASVIFSPQKGSGGAAAAPSAGGGRSAVRGDVEDNGGIDADAALFQMDEVCATKPRRCGEKGSKQKPKKIRPADKHSPASAPAAAAAVDPVVVLWGDVVGVSFDATVDEAVRSLIRSTPLFAALPVSTCTPPTPPLHRGDSPPSPSSPSTSFPFLYVIQPLQTTEEAPVVGAATGFAQGNRYSSVECWLRAGSGAVRMEGLVEVSTSSMWNPHPQHGGLSEDEERRKGEGEGVNRHRQQVNNIHRCIGEKREQEWNAFVKDDAEEREAEMETLHAQIQQLKEIRKGI